MVSDEVGSDLEFHNVAAAIAPLRVLGCLLHNRRATLRAGLAESPQISKCRLVDRLSALYSGLVLINALL